MAELKQEIAVMQSEVVNQELHLYVRSLQEAEEITGQVGMIPIETVKFSESVDIHTVILLDNSLSITEENQQRIYDVLKRYMEGKEDSEKVSIAVFGEDIEYLVEEETNSQILIEALEKIEYRNQDSFLTDILYEELSKIEGISGYCRFIVATDGVDNKAIGYTKEELQEKLKETNYPIYSLGCIYKENSQELENLFAISRLTNGGYRLLDEEEDLQAVAESLREEITCLEVQIPDEACDGSEKNILLSIHTQDNRIELTEQAKMPFKVKETEVEVPTVVEVVPEEPIAVPIEEPTLVTEAETIVEEVRTPVGFGEVITTEEKESGIDWVSIVAIGCIAISIIILVIRQIKNKNKDNKKEEKKSTQKKKDTKEKESVQSTSPTPPVMPVRPIPSYHIPFDSDEMEETTMFSADSSGHIAAEQLPLDQARYIVILRDIKDVNKEFRYPLAGKVVIGRRKMDDVNMVLGYEQSVSKRHCAIIEDRGRIYIEDLGSTYSTFLNGVKVDGRKELTSGSIIKMGKLEMIVEVMSIR